MNRRLLRVLFAPLLLLAGGQAFALCGGPLGQNSWGRALDYRAPKDRELLILVEPHHFTVEVENLVRGVNVPLPGDIHYTLMRFVNHHRALNSMANWQIKNGFQEGKEYFAADCYFERAVAFTPDDPVVFIVWGNYLYRKKDFDRALEAYTEAQRLDANNPEVYYNLGLLYIELNDLEKARVNADKAYELGHPLMGLQRKLDRLTKSETTGKTTTK